MSAANPSAELRQACDLAISEHTAAAAKALATRETDAALLSLDRAIFLYECSSSLPKTADRQFQLLAKLSEICRLLCYKQEPQKVNDALRLIQPLIA